jgi:hypothetical protein
MAHVFWFEIEILFSRSKIFSSKLIIFMHIIKARAYQALDFLKKNDAPNALKAADEASKGKED